MRVAVAARMLDGIGSRFRRAFIRRFQRDMTQTHHRIVPHSPPQLLSIVVPLFNEQSVLSELRSRLSVCAAQWPWPTEMIFVNDGSSDRTLELLVAWARDDCRVRVIGLARNFGHQAALTAGLDAA